MQQPVLLYVRKKDHAVFQKSTAPCRENPPLFLRVKYVARRWWRLRGRFELIRDSPVWSPNHESEYDVVNMITIESGFKELSRRTGNRELQ